MRDMVFPRDLPKEIIRQLEETVFVDRSRF